MAKARVCCCGPPYRGATNSATATQVVTTSALAVAGSKTTANARARPSRRASLPPVRVGVAGDDTEYESLMCSSCRRWECQTAFSWSLLTQAALACVGLTPPQCMANTLEPCRGCPPPLQEPIALVSLKRREPGGERVSQRGLAHASPLHASRTQVGSSWGTAGPQEVYQPATCYQAATTGLDFSRLDARWRQ